MARLILLLSIVAVVVLAVTSVEQLLRREPTPAPRSKEDTMPATMRTIAYVALIVLMFGIVTGWLGGN